jgi:fission process protein 1
MQDLSEEGDIWRHTPLRFAGYTNEVRARPKPSGSSCVHPSRSGCAAPLDLNSMIHARFARLCAQVGEAFRPLMAPRWVYGSYAVSIAYVLGDTTHKAIEAGSRAKSQGQAPGPQMFTTAIDVLSWQSIASVAVPGLMINRVVAMSKAAIQSAGRQPGLAPTIIGLATIPFIIKPIDHATDVVLDRSIRPALELFHTHWSNQRAEGGQANSKPKERAD